MEQEKQMKNNNLSFLDFLTMLSFLIGVYALFIALQNLDENRIQTEDTKQILYKLDQHLAEQDGWLRKEG